MTFKSEDKMSEVKLIDCLKVNQPIGTFYISVMSAGQLLPLIEVLRRGLTEEEKGNVQRSLSRPRQLEISNYVKANDATFPTSIIVAAYSDYLQVDDENKRLVIGREKVSDSGGKLAPVEYLALQHGDKIGLVLDGQHRIEGLRHAGAEESDSPLFDFELPVVFMFDMAQEDMAEVFRVINSKQRPVDSSLIFDLFGLSTERSPRKTCHTIALGFNTDKEGPLYKGLKMLGRKTEATEYLSQGSFAKYVLALISREPDEDERRLKARQPLDPDDKCPMRKLFLEGKDEIIARVLRNYFSAARATFPDQWDRRPQDYLLRKTVGFSALVKVFKQIVPKMLAEKDVTEEKFRTTFETMRSHLASDAFSVGNFGSSEAEAGKVAAMMLSAIRTVGDPAEQT